MKKVKKNLLFKGNQRHEEDKKPFFRSIFLKSTKGPLDVVDQIEGLLLNKELYTVKKIFKHELSRFSHMFGLRLVIAFVVLVFVRDRHQLLLLVQLREEQVVIEDFEMLSARGFPLFKDD